MAGFPQDGRGLAKGAAGIDELFGRIAGLTLVALFAPGFGAAAAGTGALDVAIRQKHFKLGIEPLALGFFLQHSIVVELAQKVLAIIEVILFDVRLGGAGIDVQGYLVALQRLLLSGVDGLDQGWYVLSGLVGGDFRSGAVIVAATDKQNVLFPD